MSTSWTTPDPRRTLASPPAFASQDVAPQQEPAPALRDDLLAGALSVVVTVLLGAPVGLVWAALAPRLMVDVQDGTPTLVRAVSDEFIAADAYFLGAVGLAGVIGGLVAWRLARRHGPAVVAGLCVGGLAAAYVAMVVGEQVRPEDIEQAVAAGREGILEAGLRLRAQEAVVAWPLGSLLGYLGASFVRGR